MRVSGVLTHSRLTAGKAPRVYLQVSGRPSREAGLPERGKAGSQGEAKKPLAVLDARGTREASGGLAVQRNYPPCHRARGRLVSACDAARSNRWHDALAQNGWARRAGPLVLPKPPRTRRVGAPVVGRYSVIPGGPPVCDLDRWDCRVGRKMAIVLAGRGPLFQAWPAAVRERRFTPSFSQVSRRGTPGSRSVQRAPSLRASPPKPTEFRRPAWVEAMGMSPGRAIQLTWRIG